MSTSPFSEQEYDTFNSIRSTRDDLNSTKSRLRDAEEEASKIDTLATAAKKKADQYRTNVASLEQKLIDLRATLIMLIGLKEARSVPVVDPEDIGSRER